MADIIQLLPDSVANQIAAGEVIQRPASVIKELVENAVDAGAHTISVLVTDAGRTAIQVIDDGCGMSETDARLAFERHATSKIRKADDLFSLHTMGFRGEALPSIVAVAQLTLTTRTADEEIGTKLVIHGSRVVSQEPVACPVGSNFCVENLFFNVPARRKFLKSNATEMNNILTAFERIALVYPDITFSLYSNGQEMLQLRAASLKQRIIDVFGKRISQDLLPIDIDTALCHITGFVGKPETARKKGASEYFFVNGRYMRHPLFHRAVLTAYERLVAEGMQPQYFIYFDINPADIDVNIHPTKTEIKFENEQGIFQLITAAVRDALGRFCDMSTIDFDTEGRPDIPVFDPTNNNISMPRVEYNPSYNPFEAHSRSGGTSFTPAPSPSVASAFDTEADTTLFPDEDTPADTTPPPSLITDKSPEHYQYKGRYIMTAVKSGLMIIDQHRADLRVCYEKNIARLKEKQASTQRLLFPEVMQLSPSDNILMQRLTADLTTMGFDISDLGGGSYAIAGVPADIVGSDPLTLLRNIISDAAEQVPTAQADGEASAVAATLALSLARNTAVPYGQILTNDEMEHLINALFTSSNVNYTPDGKPILCILPQTDIEQLLK